MSESDGEGPSLDDNATSRPRDNLLHRERAAISAVSVTLNIEGDILHGDVQNNVFACITDRGRLIVNFEDGRNPYTRTYTQQPSALFLDPTGCHLLVPFPSGELEYCNLEVRYSTKIPVVSPALAAVSKNPMATAASLASAASSSIAGLAAGITPFSTNQASVNASNTPFVTTAVGWDMTNTASRSTGVVLLGSKDGALVEVRLDTSYVDGTKSVTPTIKPLVAAGNPKFAFTEPIASIAVERFADHGKVVILLATTSRLVRCCGTYNPNSLRTAVEKKVGETNKSSELRGGTVGNNGRIAVYRANIGAPAVGWAWNSPAGIYHGLFKVVPTIVSEARKRSATSLDYDVDDEDDKSAGADIITLHKIPLGFKYAEIPMDIALSAHHMLLMYSDRIAVLHAPAGLRWAPTRLQGKESIDKLLPITEEHFTERLRKTFGLRGVGKAALRSIGERRSYFVTTTGFCQMEFRHEHRVTWRLFLERALDAREDADVRARYFNAAYNIVCTFEPAKKDMVAFARGKFFTEMQLYEAAAAQFADCSRVGDIIPYLTETAPTSTLLAYLHARIAKREEAAKQALSASDGRHFALGGKRPWRDPELASLIVVALNTHADRLVVEERRDPRTSDTTIVAEYKEALDDFVASRVPFIHALNDDHYYEVIQWMLAAQGQTETRVMLSVKVRKFRVSIMSYIANQEFVAACRVLTQRCQEAQYAPLWYEFGPLFVSKCPDDFFEGLYKTIKEKLGGRFDSFLRPELLLPAFTGVLQWDTDAAQVTGRYVLEYFHRLVTNNVTIPAVVWNFYVLLCTKLDSRLLGDVLVDARRLYSPAYALRKILESSDTSVLKCIISIYKELKQIREAVKIAVDTHVDGDDLLEEAKALIKDTDLDRATQKSLWKDIAVRTADNPSSTAQQILQVVAESNGDLTLDDVMPLLARRQTRLTEVKDPICRALQGYSDRIKIMKDEMDVANLTAAQIRDDEDALRNQCGFISYRLKCDICNKPLLASGGRVPFVVYPPCRHVFHEDCATEVYAHCSAERLEAIGEELGLDPSECHDPTVFRDTDCPTCGELAVAQIDDPYFDEHDAEQAVWNVLF